MCLYGLNGGVYVFPNRIISYYIMKIFRDIVSRVARVMLIEILAPFNIVEFFRA